MCRIGSYCSRSVNGKKSAQGTQLSCLYMGKCWLTNLEVKSSGEKNLSCTLQRLFPETQEKENGMYFFKENKKKFMCKESFSFLLMRYIFELRVLRRPCLVQ